MSEQIESSNSGNSLAVIFLSAAVLIFMIWQFSLVWQQKSILKNQQLVRQQIVEQSKGVQSDLQRLATDLLELAKTDAEAQALVQKYGIAQQAPAAPAPAQ